MCIRDRDNVVHYNWHWFWHWGTGEALNNGTHMIDLLRWGMKADFPVKVSSNGGRYRYKDDWQTPDTQVINLDSVSYTHLRAHETVLDIVCRLLLEKKKKRDKIKNLIYFTFFHSASKD